MAYDSSNGRNIKQNDIHWKIYDIHNGNSLYDIYMKLDRWGLDSFESTGFFYDGSHIISYTTTNASKVGSNYYSNIITTNRALNDVTTELWPWQPPHSTVAQSDVKDWLFEGNVAQNLTSDTNNHSIWTAQYKPNTTSERINLTHGNSGIPKFYSENIPANLASASKIASMTTIEATTNSQYIAAIREDGTITIFHLKSSDSFDTFSIDPDLSFILDKIPLADNTHFTDISWNDSMGTLAVSGDKISFYDFNGHFNSRDRFNEFAQKVSSIHSLISWWMMAHYFLYNNIHTNNALIAQLDRAFGCGPKGFRFESC